MLLILLLVLSNLVLAALLLKRLGREREIRRDAIGRSRSVLEGKFREQLAPILPEFKYNPTDARFLGSPVDFVVFAGLAENEPREVVFIEVKTGKSQLSSRERKIKKLVDGGKVRYEILRV